MKSKELVKIRKEKKYYLCYFVDSRRIIIVNDIGARTIDLFFNKNCPEPKIINKLLSILDKKIDKIYFRGKIRNFLKELKRELKNEHRGGFPFIEEERMDVPIVVELQINTSCNLRCRHCCQSEYNELMPFKKIKRILKILYKEKVFEINLVGGEVFLHPDILKIISLCCEKYNFATNIVTNATLLSEKMIKRFSRFRNNLAILVSLEGIGSHNDKIRGKGTFGKIDNAIKNLKKHKIYLETSTTVNAVSIKYWREVVDYCKKLNVPCNFNLFKLFKPEQKELVLKPNDYFNFIERIFKFRAKHKVEIGLTNAAIVAEINGGTPRKECKATLTGLTIDVKRRMVPCPFLDKAGYYKDKKLPIFDKNFKNKWRNNRWFKDFRRGNLRECQSCSYIFSGSRDKINPYGLTAFKKYLNSKNR
jgi:MoaA/NifB/PqqE/SkfB family radical SAM enzyme